MTGHWRFKDEWLLKALAGLEQLLAPSIAGLRARKAPYLSHSLINAGFLTEARLGRLVELKLGVGHLRLTPAQADNGAVGLLGERLCRKLRVVPVGIAGNRLLLATDSPLDSAALAEAGAAAGLKPAPRYCLPLALEACLDTLFNAGARAGAAQHRGHPAHDGKAPAAAMAESLILQARRLRATEVRIEHDEGVAEVKVRIDGALRLLMTLAPAASGPLVARLKALAHLDISERLGRQEGSARLSLGGAVLEISITVQPDIYGENAVLRLHAHAPARREKPPPAPRPHRRSDESPPPPPAQPARRQAEQKPAAHAEPQPRPKQAPPPTPRPKPAPPPKPEPAPPPRRREAVPPAFLPQPKAETGVIRVMIADPDERHRAALAKVIEAAGFAALHAENGADALAEIAQGQVPDLLITGLDMPVMTGLELIKAVRQDLDMPKLPIFILAADTSDENQEEAFRLGADDYIPAPVSAAVLGARLRAALRRAGRAPRQ